MSAAVSARPPAHLPVRRPAGFACLAVALVLLAGCADPGPAQRDGSAAVAVAAAHTWSDCRQWHLHFDALAEDFQQDVPDGFVVQADNAGLTTLLIHVTLCGADQEAVLAVPVAVPAEYDDPDRSELAVLQVFHAGFDVYPTPFATRLVDAEFHLAPDAATGPWLHIVGGQETMWLRLALAGGGGGFAAESWARFAADESGSLGVVRVDGSASVTFGSGLVGFTHEGPGGAPPATAGIAHVVQGLDLAYTPEVL